MEKYYERRIRLFASSRDTKQHLLLEQALAKASKISDDDIELIADDFYAVKSESNQGQFYFVDVVSGLCSCPIGAFGAFCKHQAALYKHKKIRLPNMPAVTKTDRHQMAILARGNTVKQVDFYRGLNVSFCFFISFFFKRCTVLFFKGEQRFGTISVGN